MTEHILVSVTDHRPVTLKAFTLMVGSLKQTGNHLLFDRRVMVHPRTNVPKGFLSDLQKNGVDSHGVDVDLSDDTYKIKLMLADFIASCTRDETVVFYLDPDHLFLTPLNQEIFPPDPGILYVSSEVSPIKNTPAVRQKYGLTTFFNTSIIFGRVAAWTKILAPWRETYHAITPLVPFRHREEIAFSIAADLAGVKVKAVSRHLQGNFSLFTRHCCMFHYGGESEDAHRIKAYLESTPDDHSPEPEARTPDSPEFSWLKQLMTPTSNERSQTWQPSPI